MKLSYIGTEMQNKKFCELISKTIVTCTFEGKCDFEKSNFTNGDFLFKSPKTRNTLIRELKQSIAKFVCGE